MTGIEAKIQARIRRPLPEICVPERVIEDTRYSGLLKAPMLARVITMTIASCALSISYFGFNNWLPSLLEARGVDLVKSLLYSSLVAVSFPLAPFIYSFFADRIERKLQIVMGSAVVIAAGLLFSVQTSFLGWTVFGVLVVMGGNLSGYGMHTYRAEQFPTGLRARAIGIIYSVDRIATAFSSFIVGFILVEVGASGVLVFNAVLALLGMVTVGVFGPKTLNTSPDSVR